MSKKRIVVVTVKPFAKAAVEKIEAIVHDAGHEFALLEKYSDNQAFLDAVSNANALIIRSDKVTREVIEAGSNLEIVVRAGAGYDNVDLEYSSEKGIVVMNTPGQNSNAVAELAVAMMLFMVRNKFNGKSGTELKGKKLGIHAYGNVGKAISTIAKGLGMEVFAYDPYITDEVMEKDGIVPIKSAELLYEQCQYISLNIPATEETKNSINYDLINRMPQGATLVNTARKEVVCEDSLKKLFDDRSDFMYLSDIAPDTSDDLVGQYGDRVFFTPKKMGAQTFEANVNAGVAAANQIIRFFENGDTTFQVNK